MNLFHIFFHHHNVSTDLQKESWLSVRSKPVCGKSWCRKILRMSPAKRWVCFEHLPVKENVRKMPCYFIFIYFFFFSHYCVTLHFACTCLFLSWMCSLDPNRAGNAHDMQSARVQGVHRQWDDCHSGPDGQSYGDLWPRVLGRLTSETPLLLLAAENIKCFWSPTPVSRIWFSQSAR